MDAGNRRRLAAELVVIEAFDAVRQAAGHDYGCGQRGAELMRRRAALEAAGLSARNLREPELVPPTELELELAFAKIGRPRMRRLELEGFRHHTPSSRRTIETWRRVERLFAPEAL